MFRKGMPHPEMVEAIIELYQFSSIISTVGMSYAIHGGDLGTVATSFGVTRERVRQIVLKIWYSYRRFLRNGEVQREEYSRSGVSGD